MPPVRDASTKPSAATVLPAPSRVLEPEALRRIGVLGLLGELLLVRGDVGIVGLLVPVGERRLGLGAIELGLQLCGDVVLILVLVLVNLGGSARELVVVLVLIVAQLLVVLVFLLLLGRVRRLLAGAPQERSVLLARVLDSQDLGVGQQVVDGGPVLLAVGVAGKRLGEEGCERSREGIDLVSREERLVGELRLVLGKHAFEPEQQREVAPPSRRWNRQAGVELGERLVERAPAGRAGGQGERWVLTRVRERLARELLSACEIGIAWVGDCDSH
jgi:hypothetical protein